MSPGMHPPMMRTQVRGPLVFPRLGEWVGAGVVLVPQVVEGQVQELGLVLVLGPQLVEAALAPVKPHCNFHHQHKQIILQMHKGKQRNEHFTHTRGIH